jgi:adenylosuccinate lyase
VHEWMPETELWALSPLDGRYAPRCAGLREVFCEASLIKCRLRVEILYLSALAPFLRLGQVADSECHDLLAWAASLSTLDLQRVKALEAQTQHDVKAVEYFLREHLQGSSLARFSPWIHWGLTSEDVDNLAFGLMLREAYEGIILPAHVRLLRQVLGVAREHAALVMPARTHGQIAVPTTLGKEFVVFASRAAYFLDKLKGHCLGGKLNGAVGNFNAQSLLFPERDWITFSQQFVASLGLSPTVATTQIEPCTHLVLFLDLLRQLYNVWLDLARDCWLYVSFGYLRQKPVSTEVGSSTMPHKINPVHFENAEGNLEMARALLAFLSDKLPISRLQRDLSDKTVKRNMGVAVGHGLVAVLSLSDGLTRVVPDAAAMRNEVLAHPEVMAEAVQLLLRVRGREQAFGQVQDVVRDTKGAWDSLVSSLPENVRDTVVAWKTDQYVGLAQEITLREVERIEAMLAEVPFPQTETC